jgi:hypothetical protein
LLPPPVESFPPLDEEVVVELEVVEVDDESDLLSVLVVVVASDLSELELEPLLELDVDAFDFPERLSVL